MFFDSWHALLHTIVVGTLAYIGLIALLRIAGKRSLSKWNPFDFIITVAFGAVMGTALTSADTPLTKILLAIALLVGLQYAITSLTVRFRSMRTIIKPVPVLLVCRGRILDDVLLRERITENEVLAALRARGVACLEDAEAVVLESDGSVSVIEGGDYGVATTLGDVRGYPDTTNVA